MDLKLGLFLFFSLGVCFAEVARYDNYRVHRITPQNDQQLEALRKLEESKMFTFWKGVGRLNQDVDILVPPHQRPLFASFVEGTKMTDTIMIENVQELFESQRRERENHKRSVGKAIDWESYYDLDDIYAWLNELASENDNIKVVNAGKTYEGRDLLGIEIVNGNDLPGVILESGIHAREWIGPAATSWIINEIINSDSNSLWKQYNYLYFPVTNPDGYVFTWTSDRAWRKTRTPYKYLGIITCYGADPNRNWDFHWMDGGSSSNPCDETFAGPEAFSETEVKNLANYLDSVSSKYDIYVAFHSYSQLLMYPWGYTGEDTPFEGTWKRIGLAAAADLKAVHGTSFTVGSIYDTIYQASGSSIEYYFGKHNSSLTFVFELRDTGRYGFQLPANQIIPSGEELIEAIRRFLVEYPTAQKSLQ